MKTHILQLEQHDDILSARDKMGWGKAGRILIVWPDKGRVLNRRLDLALLQRRGLELGAQLALVTHDPDVRYHAPRLGIPVFKTLRQAQSTVWRLPRRFRKAQTEETLTPRQQLLQQRPERPPESAGLTHPPRSTAGLSPILRLALFTLGVLSFLSLAALFLPKAEVTLTPKTQLQEITIDIQASTQNPAVTLSGAAPARLVSVTVEGRDSVPVSSSMQIPDRPATGSVLFTNLTDQAVKIPLGSIVSSQGENALRFAVTEAGETPAGPGQTLSLPVRCLTLGSQGNLPAQSLTAIEGTIGTQLSASNPLPTRSGADRKEPAPSQADRQKLSARLRTALQKTALEELQAGLAEDDQLLASSLSLQQVIEETYQPALMQPADRLNLSLRAEFQAVVVSGADLRSLAQIVLDASLPAGYIPLTSPPAIENLTTPQLTQGTARWKLHAYRHIQAVLPKARAIQLTLGQNPTQAAQRLANALPLETFPTIALNPAWWPRLPLLPFRITLRNLGTLPPTSSN